MRLTPRPPKIGARRGRAAAAAGATVVVAAATLMLASTGQAGAAPGCRVDYSASNWGGGGGFTGSVRITNVGDPVAGWTLTFTWPGNQRVSQGWNATWNQAAGSASVSAASLDWNRNLATGQAVDIGFNGTFTGANTAPTSFALNGTTCTGATTPPTSTTTTTTTTSQNPNPGNRQNNPYAGASVYVNADWAARVNGVAGGSRIANQPTGVWMDRIAAINGTTGARGLAAHLDAAVQQDAANGAQGLVFQVVIYNLPGRDCAALASNGELGPTEIDRYRTQYIDPIATILARPAYANLRIVTIIEIDSLPNLITNVAPRNTQTPQCDTMKANGNYVNGVGYALNRLGDVPNVYNYIDAGHHGWIGWDDNFNPTVQLMCQAANASGATPADVWGFIANTANYSALSEPFFNANTVVGGRVLREVSGGWVDFNRYVDELTFAQAFRNQADSQCFDANIGMLIDTSRNGWGGPNRPTAASTSTDPITFMEQSRIDRRIHLGNWCNQSGAGLGERPRSAPASGIDAYVWIKPPGESDGSSTEIPNDEGKGFDRMCDPTYTGNPRNNNHMSGALGDAPLSGHFFPAQLTQLMQNAFPPL
ncbi:MAG TPA: glycoside hydrolase family 6 protein [Actinophytocola sp.]|uniref:glycoside hydrolase family 6 protein n=1 Tax=Actinophytocola sp. TaxID=1872138 RepID=UPI002DBB1E66|nr:glycoside hydrolase family 6 protein [Actinophytocola sp.]HEU5470512.1 glycoside hydrolase family 6 protein [Actinophytocola sp.]